MIRPKSLRARLLWAALLWVLCATAAGSWALSYAFRNTVQDAFDARLTSLLMAIIGVVDVESTGQAQLGRSIGEPQFESIYSGWYWLVAERNEVLLHSRSLWDLNFPIPALPVSASPTLWSTADALEREVRVAAQSVIVPGTRRPLTFVVTADLSALHQEMRRFDLLLYIALGALGIGLVIAVLVQVNFGLKPLERLAKEVETVRNGSARSLQRSGTRELDVLVDEMNTLIEHNQRIVERARASASDLAHALKTPLAVMRSSRTDTAEASVEHSEQIATMERIVTRHLARAATAGPGRRTLTPIEPIVDELARGLKRVHAGRDLRLTLELPTSLAYNADREDLEEMIGNLLENAFKWAHCCIRLSARVDERRLLLTVEDDGPGLGRDQAIHATKRGTRFDEQTPGTGLGLAIVTDIAEIYRGTLQLRASPLGGLAAELSLPLDV